MKNLSSIGRIFFGSSIAVLGILTIYYRDFPYMLIPYDHSWIPSLAVVAYVAGGLLVWSGVCIVLEKKITPASLLLGCVLLIIFCFYFVPYQFMVSPNFMQFIDWENSAKELALATGALVMAQHFYKKSELPLFKFLEKLLPLGTILFSITIISFGIDHYVVGEAAAEYVPSWIPYRVFWIYFTGTALIASGLGIILKIKNTLAATLLGAMTFTWFVILHIPRIVASPPEYLGSEISSAFLALAYSGIALVIAGNEKV
ncbi:MAG: hypothetical protein JST48_07290 [Bacteroidetes bacterium]|nr:hypothetical protein [Bacteroidota bacterium]